MAELKLPWLSAESGTYAGTTIVLSGSPVDLGGYPTRTFSEAESDPDADFSFGDSMQITVSADASTWAIFSGAIFTNATTIDLASATVTSSMGVIAGGSGVFVFAGMPATNTADFLTKSVYDPGGVNGDAFARSNHTGTQLLATISDAGTAAGADTTDFDTAGSAAAVNAALTTHKGSGDHDSRYPLQTRTVNTGGSLSGGGDLSADRTLSLSGDTESPGNSRYYGTDEVGARGYHDLPLSSGANTDRESGPTSGSYAWDLAVYPGGFVVDPTDIVHFDAPTDPPPLDVNELHSFRLTITFGAFAHTWDTVWVNPPVPNPGTGMYIIAGEYDGEKYVLATPVLAR